MLYASAPGSFSYSVYRSPFRPGYIVAPMLSLGAACAAGSTCKSHRGSRCVACRLSCGRSGSVSCVLALPTKHGVGMFAPTHLAVLAALLHGTVHLHAPRLLCDGLHRGCQGRPRPGEHCREASELGGLDGGLGGDGTGGREGESPEGAHQGLRRHCACVGCLVSSLFSVFVKASESQVGRLLGGAGPCVRIAPRIDAYLSACMARILLTTLNTRDSDHGTNAT